MRKAVRRIAALVISAVLTAGVLPMAAACGNKQGEGSYTIIYDLNYEGGGERRVNMQAGANIVDWQAPREGYDLIGWYTDPQCEEKFSFPSTVDSTLTLYALWRQKQGYVTVSFDYGYNDAPSLSLSTEKGKTIAQEYVEDGDRLGMVFEGWYTDEACTQEWNMEEDTVQGDMTLYAGYSYDPSFVPRDENGDIIYEDVSVVVWVNGTGDVGGNTLLPVMQDIAAQFNAEHEGEIEVIVTSSYSDYGGQAGLLSRIQRTNASNVSIQNNYSIADVYDVAGVEWSPDDYVYAGRREATVYGEMMSVPLYATVPYIAYNKSLMQKYNGNDPLPSNYGELSALLRKAAEGESGNQNFRSIVINDGWSFKEWPSMAPFVQNDAEYFQYFPERVGYASEWNLSEVQQRAQNALQITYDLFGAEGKDGGAVSGSTIGGNYDMLLAGNALMSVFTLVGMEDRLLTSSDVLGVMPLSNLFTDETGEAAMRIPAHTVSLGYYRYASAVSNTQMCAAALFTDYMSRHSYVFAEYGLIPLRKSVLESDEYVNSTNATVNLIKQYGDPDHFYATEGYQYAKEIVNTVSAEKYILPFLETDGQGVAETVENWTRSILTKIY